MARRHNKKAPVLNTQARKSKKVPTNYKSALSLFGGRDKIIDRMTKTVCERLKPNNPCKYKPSQLEKYLNLPPRLLEQIKQGQNTVDVELFEKLKGPLGLCSIYEILGSPDFKSDEALRGHWEKERKTDPMHVVAREGGQAQGEIPDEPISLEFYVTLRAIGELHKTKPRRGR